MDISEGLRNEMWRKILPVAKKHIEKVFVVSLTPVLEDRFPAKGWFDRDLYHLNSDIEDYNLFLKNLCEEFNIPFIDVATAMLEHNLEELLFDSSHPNEKGHQVIAAEILRQTKNLL